MINGKSIVGSRREPHRSGFTLVELLVVIAIIGILLGMMFPALQSVRESARLAQCQLRLQQLHLAVSEYHAAHRFWPIGTQNPTGPIANTNSGYHHNWIAGLLPYMDRAVFARRLDSGVSVYAGANLELGRETLPEFRCPSAGIIVSNASNYAGSHHSREAPIDLDNRGTFILNQSLSPEVDFVDGLRETLALGEKLDKQNDLGWLSGTRATLRNVGAVFESGRDQHRPETALSPVAVGGFGSAHPGGAVLAMADGSVRVYSRQTDQVVLTQLADRSDGMDSIGK
jgi:prepilin-type N-terminal cleavage/methylation domain-containing protein/prepilin-type processing-associated H-X9-DG protein